MTEIDQFESVFKAADKTPFALETVEIRRPLLITDTDLTDSLTLRDEARQFLRVLQLGESAWQVLPGDGFSGVKDLLTKVEGLAPDLICTYRNLRIPATDYPHSLGVYVDVLTQVSRAPVLLLPHPSLPGSSTYAAGGTDSVMAITDHLAGDHHLVSYAARLTLPNGKLWLTHVEDEAIFERYLATIGKIPAIDTETARQEIRAQLLKEPHDYIRSCRDVLSQATPTFDVEAVITFGHYLNDYKELIDEHSVDLLVMNTKHDGQLAMHGAAYSLAVELRDTPLLLL